MQHEPIPGWEPPSALERKRILDDTRSIAIVGASANPARASNFVATYLLSSSADFTIYLVNPRETEIRNVRQLSVLSAEDLADIAARRGVDVSPENICIMPGGKPTMFFAILM